MVVAPAEKKREEELLDIKRKRRSRNDIRPEMECDLSRLRKNDMDRNVVVFVVAELEGVVVAEED